MNQSKTFQLRDQFIHLARKFRILPADAPDCASRPPPRFLTLETKHPFFHWLTLLSFFLNVDSF